MPLSPPSRSSASPLRALVLAGLSLTALAGMSMAQDRASSPSDRRMSPELLWKLARVSGGSFSPDGRHVLCSVRRYDLAENGGDSDLWLLPVDGSSPRRLTDGPGSEGAAQWVRTPEGPRVFVLASRPGSEGRQAWSIDPDSGRWTQVSAVAGGIGNLKVSPRGTHIAYTHEVAIGRTTRDLFPDLPKADALVIDDLMYRHWDRFSDNRWSHVFVAALGDDGRAGPGRDLMQGLAADCPVPPFGGASEFAWAPEGDQIALTMKLVSNWAESTDSDVYLIDLDEPERRFCLTVGMNGYDKDPLYSPDGRYVAFQSMERAGFESDRNRIMLHDRRSGAIFDLSEGFDRTTHSLRWSPDSKALYFQSETRGTNQIFRITVQDRAVAQITSGTHNWSLRDVSADGAQIVLGRQDMLRPWELFLAEADGSGVRRLSDFNREVYEALELPTVEERWVRATDGERIHCWVIKPPDFDPSAKHPMLLYCQGGPQGQVGQWFSFRWNFHLMAAQGYVVIAPNRRGLPGFGRKWNDDISQDWGGQAMQDLLAATDDMLTEPYVDAKRVGAIGASFGGYTTYWLMGNHERRFGAMISHCGVFNLESMYGSTEELFFVNWDLGGPYWQSEDLQADYNRFSPHRFVRNWDTPLLVIHGQRDYRVPVTQGMEAFTAAKVQGVPARFLYFPDEGHWVLSPQNGVLWHRVFFDWLGRHLAAAKR